MSDLLKKNDINFRMTLQERKRLADLQEFYNAAGAAIIRAALEAFDPQWPIASHSLPVLDQCGHCGRYMRNGRENEHGDVILGATATDPETIECSADDQEIPF